MRVSIGILAWNEADSIARTIELLLQQTLFTTSDSRIESIEVVCVPNGCTDSTAEKARKAFDQYGADLAGSVNFRVCEVSESGKSNAWNLFIHEFSDQAADFIFLMDADVIARESEALANLLNALEASPQAMVAIPQFIKDIAFKPRKTLFDRVSLSFSRKNQQSEVPLAGGLYCGRGEVLRGIYLPNHLLVEDGFLRAMILTDQFRAEEDFQRIVRAEQATVMFKACTALGGLFRHERRVAMGTVMNTLLFGEVAPRCDNPGVGEWISRQNEIEPDWPLKLVAKKYSQNGRWLVPRMTLFRRFDGIKKGGLTKALKQLPLALCGFAFDLPVFIAANSALRRGCIRGA